MGLKYSQWRPVAILNYIYSNYSTNTYSNFYNNVNIFQNSIWCMGPPLKAKASWILERLPYTTCITILMQTHAEYVFFNFATIKRILTKANIWVPLQYSMYYFYNSCNPFSTAYEDLRFTCISQTYAWELNTNRLTYFDSEAPRFSQYWYKTFF